MTQRRTATPSSFGFRNSRSDILCTVVGTPRNPRMYNCTSRFLGGGYVRDDQGDAA